MEEKKGLLAEFRTFITKGNVLDMAVGVIVAGAFGKITTSLVNDVFMPFIGYLIGGIDLAKFNITLREAVVEGETVLQEAVVIGIGTFLATVIDFILVAFVVFMVVKTFNKARALAEKKKKEEEAAAEEAKPEEPPKPTTEELLAEILEELRKQN